MLWGDDDQMRTYAGPGFTPSVCELQPLVAFRELDPAQLKPVTF